MGKKIVVIGGGPAGYPAALAAAGFGAEVTLVEQHKIGGVCLNWGCIPSKSLLDAAHRFDTARGLISLCNDEAPAHAQALFQSLSWPKIQQRQKAVTARLGAGILGMLRAKKINYMQGQAQFLNANELHVNMQDSLLSLPFDGLIIATGSRAFLPPPFDTLQGPVYDNSTIFDIPSLPKTLTIVGSGVIGCEFATLMTSLGVEVNLLEMKERLLPAEDESFSRLLTQSLTKRGVHLFLGTRATAAQTQDGQQILTLENGQTVASDAILVAIGRTVDLTALQPEKAGIEWTRKGITVNAQTLQVKDTIYAAGDVTGLCLLAHAATRQGEVAAANLCGQTALYNNQLIPSVIYTQPELASIGLNKQKATEQGIDFKAQKAFLLASGRALTQDAGEGFIEILSDKKTGQIIGAQMAGLYASELIHILAVAVNAKLTTTQLREVVFAHPTVSESILDALNK